MKCPNCGGANLKESADNGYLPPTKAGERPAKKRPGLMYDHFKCADCGTVSWQHDRAGWRENGYCGSPGEHFVAS